MTLDELEKLCNEATPGPWRVASGDWRVVNFNHYPVCGTSNVIGDDESNADFIAAARTYLPKLIDVAKAAEGLLPRCRELANQHFDVADGGLAEGDQFEDWEKHLKDALAALEQP